MEPSSSASGTASSSSPSSSHRGGGRELQGPRPAPLRVRHKIRKQPPPQQVREPLIIYTVSPKVVHAQPSEFMSVVQRLTGGGGTATASSSSVPAPAAAPPHHHHHQIMPTTLPPSLGPFPFFGGAPSSSSAALLPTPPAPHFPFQLPQHELMPTTELSPAARLAAIEQAARSSGGGGAGGGGSLLMPPFPPGILSPAGSLPAIQPASFFSPPPPGAGINLFGELISPAAAFLDGAGTQAAGATSHQNVMLQQAEAAEASPSAGGPYYWGDLFDNQQHYHQN